MPIMNYIFISPNFPKTYRHFVSELRNAGVNVFGIGDEPFASLSDDIISSLTEYCFVKEEKRWIKLNSTKLITEKMPSSQYSINVKQKNLQQFGDFFICFHVRNQLFLVP